MNKVWTNIAEIIKHSGFDGNIDNNSIKPFIFMSQDIELKRILGNELHNKITTDFNSDNLSGLYLEMFEKYIKTINIYFSCSFYLKLGVVKVSQNGAYFVTPERTEQVAEEKTHTMAQIYENLAIGKENDLLKFLASIDIPEWKNPNNTKSKSVFNWLKV